MHSDEIKDLVNEIPSDFLLNFLLKRVCEIVWIYDLDSIKFQNAFINTDKKKLHPVDLKNSVLGERIASEERLRISGMAAEYILKANLEKRHVDIPAFHTTHIDSRGKQMLTVGNLMVYYDETLGHAKYLIGDTRIDYERMYKELIMNMLSKREKEYLKLYMDKKSPKEICRIMDVEANTVSSYKNSIKSKTGMSSIEEVTEIIFI